MDYKVPFKEIASRLAVSRQTLRDFIKMNPKYYQEKYDVYEDFVEYKPRGAKPATKVKKKKK